MRLLDTQIELNEDFILPNSRITYDVYFDGDLTFEARLSESNFERGVVMEGLVPKLLRYKMFKPLDEFTEEEKAEILSYRGLTLSDGFEAMDVFMEKSHISLLPKLFSIDGYFKEDKSEFNGLLVSEYDSIEDDDEDIFFYGLSENEINEAIEMGGTTAQDFVITSYEII